MTSRKLTQRASTGDRGPPEGEKIEILTVEQLGPHMSRLPNGSLLCKDVPIARTGWMMYGPGETPITVGSAGIAYVERTEDDLFNADCLGSFMGAAVVDEHPEDDVTPANWKKLAKGFATTNVRRGMGDDADVMLADLIATDQGLIDSILAGKREVSLGYEADYEQTGAGQGRQTNIIGNHIALVEKGRCGPRCAIGDRAHPSSTVEKETHMPASSKRVVIKPQRRAVLDAARQRVADAEKELESAQEEAAENEMGEGATHIHIHAGGKEETKDDVEAEADPYEERFKTLETGMAAMADSIKSIADAVRGKEPTEDEEIDEDDKKKVAETKDGDDDEDVDTDDGEAEEEEEEMKEKPTTKDSAALQSSYVAVLAQAEILVPGFRMGTFDAKAKRKATVDAMCGARRKCLDMAYSTKDGQTLVDGVSGRSGLNIAKMDCKAVAILFRAASGAKALLNNQSAATRDSKVGQPEVKTGPLSLADLNRANRDYWEARKIKV